MRLIRIDMMAVTLACSACGGESSGLLSDQVACRPDAAAVVEASVAEADAANEGGESSVVLAGTDGEYASHAQSLLFDDDVSIWGVAVKLVAPGGAGGDIEVRIANDLTEGGATAGESVSPMKTASAAQTGVTPTWLLVDFGEPVILEKSKPYYLTLTPSYGASETSPVSWITVTPGTGLQESYDPDYFGREWTTVTGYEGVHVLQECK